MQGSHPGPWFPGTLLQLQNQYLEFLKPQPLSQIGPRTNSSLFKRLFDTREATLTCHASTEAAVVWFLREPASPQICSAAGKFHQGKQEGNGKADAGSLNEILNCEILTVKTPSTQAKEPEKQPTPTFQQLVFPWCAELTDLLAPWHRNEKCPPRWLPLPSFLTLATPMRCSQTPPQKHHKQEQNLRVPPQGKLCHFTWGS